MMIFRKAIEADIPQMAKIYDQARASLKARGISQWQKGSPNRDVVKQDIKDGISYVLIDDNENTILAQMVIVFENEESYNEIDGAWKNNEPYGTFHRVAVDEAHKGKGIAAALFEEGKKLCRLKGYRNIRIDTHPDNVSMQHALEKSNFERCGHIILKDGSEAGDGRIAYQLIL